jgi:DNA-binding MarR family transcriptional regulator
VKLSLLTQLKIPITDYLILEAINYYFGKYYNPNTQSKFKVPPDTPYIHPELILNQDFLARILNVDSSTISRHFKDLEKYIVLDEEKFIHDTVSSEEFVADITDDDDCLILHYDLFRYVRTKKQILILTYLWKKYRERQRKLIKREVYKYLPVSKVTLDNTLNRLVKKEIITIHEDKTIEFSKWISHSLEKIDGMIEHFKPRYKTKLPLAPKVYKPTRRY